MCQPVVAALLAAVAASCGLSVGGLEGEPQQGAGGSSSGSGVSGVTTTTSTGEAVTTTVTTTVTTSGAGGGVPAGEYVWHSYDVKDNENTGEVFVPDTKGVLNAKISFYQGAMVNMPDTSVSLSFRKTGVPDNPLDDLDWFYAPQYNPYPYIGKSSKQRGAVPGDKAPMPPTALDMQLHPPDQGKYVYAAFSPPVAGHYILSDLADRRVLKDGDHTTLEAYVLMKQDNMPKSVHKLPEAKHDQKWVVDMGMHDLGPLLPEDQIVFEVGSGDGDAFDDALEVAWTISTIIP